MVGTCCLLVKLVWQHLAAPVGHCMVAVSVGLNIHGSVRQCHANAHLVVVVGLCQRPCTATISCTPVRMGFGLLQARLCIVRE
jgi:hypothetical protein